MIRNSIYVYILFFCLLFTTGCWDRKELNYRALWLATGWDVAEKEKILLSGQIVVPSNMQSQNGSGGGGAQSFFTISATGKNVNDATQNQQSKMSRESFTGHRKVIFISEEFAKRGVQNQFDANIRGPDVSLRADLFVVKGARAIDVMNLSNPLENPPAVAAIKGHQEYGGRGDKAFLKLLIAANSDGIRATLPVIEIAKSNEGGQTGNSKPPDTVIKVAGVAIFNKNLEMIGMLNNKENRSLLWMLRELKKLTITVPVKEGNASLILTSVKRKIKAEFDKDNRIKFTVILAGKGSIYESNSNINLNSPTNVKYLKKKFEKNAQENVKETITKVQEEYAIDIFGFGEEVHKNHPKIWKKLKKDWDKHFAEAEITVKANLKVERIGLSGPSVLYKESVKNE